MTTDDRPHLLPDAPTIPEQLRAAVADDYHRFATEGWPQPLEEYLTENYHIDVATTYAGLPIKNPWGKASGQLSMTARQVQDDVDAGLGYVVLKTLIAEDETGAQMMHAWTIKEPRMLVEPITGRSGAPGWTVSWKGRGWWLSFDEYLQLIRDAQRIAQGTGTLIVPSCKYHLPTPDEDFWKEAEYQFTTAKLLNAWRDEAENPDLPMPLEKDFSPTLAGSGRASQQAKIIEWLTTVPQLVRDAVANPSDVRIGLKIFNALFDDEFQLDMLRAVHDAQGNQRPDFHVYGNRLFDPDREFDGHRGIAYGGPDLSDRNLRIMTRLQQAARADEISTPLIEWSATGDICTGKMALEYALRGASSFQLHTFFQLPSDQYTARTGSKTQKALHELYFHPDHGLIVWMSHLADQWNLDCDPIRLRDIIAIGSARDVN